MSHAVGLSLQRQEAWDKVTGAAKYNDDTIVPGIFHAKLVTSAQAHAKIISIDTTAAVIAPGVLAVITGENYPLLCGSVIADRPILATQKVRYFGEPLAIVVATEEALAMKAAKKIQVKYEPLPVINSISEALVAGAPLVHENLANYEHVVPDVYPEPNTNICNRVQVRKGDYAQGWAESEVVVEAAFALPQSDHIAMETRNARAEILPSGQVIINTSTQGPFSVQKQLKKSFGLDESKITVKTPFVGGAFGGKAAVQLELLAFIASQAVGGKPVKIANTREEDIVTSPCKLGLEARIKLGATRDGRLKALEITYFVDTGAYADTGPRMTKAIAVSCTGPYNIENVWCDALTVYTNHPYATSFRGFGHMSLTFCMERTIDKLANTLGLDPVDIRMKNAISTGHTSPTMVDINPSSAGDLHTCLSKLKSLINWQEGRSIELGKHKTRAKGISCFWKTSDSPTNALSGVLLTFNVDGSINLHCGAVEMGPGMKTTAAQILAEKLKLDMTRIQVVMEVNTATSPKHWKTVASMTTFLVGNAVLAAADDLISQLCQAGAMALQCRPEEVTAENEWVRRLDDPTIYIAWKELVHGYKLPNGNTVGSQIIGRGSYIMPNLTTLNPLTGAGKAGPYWTVGAQAIEVEFDHKDFTYRLLKAATVMDAGTVINPKTAKGLIMGGMCMGLGVGTREAFAYKDNGEVETTSLRTYKVMHFGETPEYFVEFIQTPQMDAPYGARGLGEHGILGIPAALANALSTAAQAELDHLPLTPEVIWKKRQEARHDSL